MKTSLRLSNVSPSYTPTALEIVLVVLVLISAGLVFRHCSRSADPQIMCDEIKRESLIRNIAQEEVSAAEFPEMPRARLERLRAEFVQPCRLYPSGSP